MNIKVFRETNFKDTELGPLPEDWQVVRLVEVLRETDVRVNDLGQSAYQPPVLSLTKNEGLVLQTERFGKRIATEDISKYKVVRHGQIVYNPYVIWEGAVHVLKKYDAGIVSPVYLVWEVRADKTHTWFIDHLLRMPASIDAYNRLASGAVNRRRAIKKDDFLSVLIPLPPLPEQRAIAHVLRTVQEAKQATERVVAALRDLKKSLMRYLFTYGVAGFNTENPEKISAPPHVNLKDTELGPLPEHWQVVRLREVAEVRYGKAKPKAEGRVPVIGSGGVYDWTATPLVDFPTLIIGRKGTAGQVWLAEQPSWPADTTFYLQWNQPVDVWFLFGFLNLNPLSGEHAKTTLPSLQRPDLENYLIPLPPLREQREIARILQTVDKCIQAEETYARALEDLFKSLLHELMTGRLRVAPDSATETEPVGTGQPGVGATYRFAPTTPTTEETKGG